MPPVRLILEGYHDSVLFIGPYVKVLNSRNE